MTKIPSDALALDGAHGWLLQELASRHRRAAGGLTGGGVAPGEVTVPVALRAFDPAAVVSGAMRFAARLTAADADAWFRCYTRTLFLFGNPVNLGVRYPPALVAESGTTAWLGVYDARRTEQVRRLLRPVEGVLPPVGRLGLTVGPADQLGTVGCADQLGTVGCADRAGWRLRIAVRGLDLPRYLVHLHHTLAEAVLTGVLPPDATVTLEHVQDLDPDRVRMAGYSYVRVHPVDADAPPRLFTVLTRDDDAARD